METPAIDLKTVGLSLLAVVLMEWAAKTAAYRMALPPMIVLGTLRSLEIATFLTIASFFGAHGLATIGIHATHLRMGLKKGILWSVGFGLLTATVFGIVVYAGVNPLAFMKTDMPSKQYEILLFFIIGAVISPIAEEIFFRGILYGFFRRWGMWVAVLTSTLLFVMAHTMSNKIPVPQAIGGILFAIAYEKEKNLVVPMVIHMSGNFAIFTLALYSQ